MDHKLLKALPKLSHKVAEVVGLVELLEQSVERLQWRFALGNCSQMSYYSRQDALL